MSGKAGISRSLPNDEYQAAVNAANPGTTNPFATDAEIDALQVQIDNFTGGSGNYIISGNVSWSGSGLIYDVTTHVYVIQGTQYISAATQVTITSDPTDPQYWVVYGDDTGSIGTIAGTPAPVPVPPSVDGLTQIVLATILVPAGATVPVITEINVYDENAGTPTEWAGTSDDTNVNFASTNDPFQGTVSIETNLPLGTNREIVLTPASPYTIVDPSTLVFQIKAKVDMSATTGRLYIGFFNGGSLVGNSVYIGGTTLPIYGFDATDTSGYQIVSIPMAAFGVLPATVGALRFFKLSGSSTADFFLDDVHILEGGAVTPPTTVINFNDLGDVTLDFDTSLGVQDDDGKYPYYDETTQQFITSEEVNHGTVIINGKKSTAGTIAKGLPVYLVGEDNDVVTVELADANGAGTIPVIGFTAEPLNDTESKHIMTFGKLTGVNTTNAVTTINPNGETWTINQALYISTTPGGLTNVRPTGASTAIQRVAKVLKVDATGGHLQVFNTFRTAGLPNVGSGNIWVGDSDGYPQEEPLCPFLLSNLQPTDIVAVCRWNGSSYDRYAIPASDFTGGGGGSVWTPPKIGIEDITTGNTAPLLLSGTTGVRYVYFTDSTTGPGGVTNPTIEFTKYMGQDDGNEYDGSALSFRIHYQLFNTTPTAGSDNVRWSPQIYFIREGNDNINTPDLLGPGVNMNVLGKNANTGYSEILVPQFNTSLPTGVRGIKVILRRLNSDVADTYPNDIDLIGIEIIN